MDYQPSSPDYSQPEWQYPQGSAPSPGYQQPVQAPVNQRKLENTLLNLALFFGSFLIISATSLLVYSVGTAPLQIMLLCLLTVAVYVAGLATYRWVPKLRLASYSFTATGLALIPLCGVAIYRLVWPYSGSLLWLIVSLVGTLAVGLALAIMPARVMAYVGVAFMVSDVLAVSSTVQVGLLWYFVGLLLLATGLALFQQFSRDRVPTQLAKGITDSSRFFVPLTMVAVLVLWSRLQTWEASLIFALGTLYSVVFMMRQDPLSNYIQARIYSLLSVYFLTVWISAKTGNDTYLTLPIAVLLLLSVLLLVLLPLPQLPWRQSQDALITWVLAQPLVALSLAAITWNHNLGSALFHRSEASTTDTLLIGGLCLLDLVALSLLARTAKVGAYLPLALYALGAVSFLILPPLALAIVLLGLACLFWVRSTADSRLQRVLGIFAPLATAALVLAFTLLSFPQHHWALLLFAALFAIYHITGELEQGKNPAPVAGAQLGLTLTLLLTAVPLISTAFYAFRYYPGAIPVIAQPQVATHLHYLALTVACLLGLILAGALLTASRAYLPQPRRVAASYQATPWQVSQPTSETPVGLLVAIYLVSAWALVVSTTWGLDEREYILSAGLLAGALAVLPRARKELHAHIGIFTRLIVLWIAVRVIYKSSFTTDQYLLIFAVLMVLMALVSLLISRAQTEAVSQLEIYAGVIFSWAAAITGLTLLREEWGIYSLTGVLALAVLTLTLQLGQRLNRVVIVQTVVALTALLLLLTPLAMTVTGLYFTRGFLLIGCVMLVLGELWAVFTPSPAHPGARVFQLGNFSYAYNAARSRTSLICASLLLLFVYVWGSVGVGVLAVLLCTLAWWAKSSPAKTHYPLLIGFNAMVLKFAFRGQADNALFYLAQCAVATLSLLVLISYFRRKHQPQAAPGSGLFWVAFGLQAFGTLFLPIFTYWLWFPDRVLLVIVTALLVAASCTLEKKAPIYLSAAMLCYQLLYLMGGLNIYTMFLIGFALIGAVVWRLLARDETPSQPTTPAPYGQQAPAPYGQQEATSYGQPAAHDGQYGFYAQTGSAQAAPAPWEPPQQTPQQAPGQASWQPPVEDA